MDNTLGMREATCRVCGERFTFYPRWHQWLVRIDSQDVPVCRYNCMREVEKKAAEARREKAKEKEKAGKKYGPRKREPEWYRKQAEACEEKRDKFAFDMRLMKNSGYWKTLPEGERKRIAKLEHYYRVRAKEMREKLEELEAAATAV